MSTGENAGVARIRHADHALLLRVLLRHVVQTVHLRDVVAAVLNQTFLRHQLNPHLPVHHA